MRKKRDLNVKCNFWAIKTKDINKNSEPFFMFI